jgi:hypothetical protein
MMICGLLAGMLAVVSPKMRNPSQEEMHRQTARILKGLSLADTNYLKSNRSFPATLDECFEAAVSNEYRWDERISSEERAAILARRDGWGRALEFERRNFSDGKIKVIVVSRGLNGVRDFDERTYYERGELGDDLIAEIYLEPKRKDDRRTSERNAHD